MVGLSTTSKIRRADIGVISIRSLTRMRPAASLPGLLGTQQAGHFPNHAPTTIRGVCRDCLGDDRVSFAGSIRMDRMGCDREKNERRSLPEPPWLMGHPTD